MRLIFKQNVMFPEREREREREWNPHFIIEFVIKTTLWVENRNLALILLLPQATVSGSTYVPCWLQAAVDG